MNSQRGNGAWLSRRSVLGLLAAGGAGLATGCQVSTTSTSSGGSNPKAIKIPDYPTKLPSGNVTLRWVDSGDLKSVWEKSVLDAFSKKHSNIKTQYDGNGWPNVDQVVPLGIRNHSAPDVFALPEDVPPQVAITQGWVQPVDDIMPGFADWKAHATPSEMIPGINQFDGKMYSLPNSSNRRLERMDVFDSANMKAAGYDDPATQITTWDDLTAAFAKVKKNGKIPLMAGGDNIGGILSYLARTAGWTGLPAMNVSTSGMDMKTGEFVYTDDKFLQAYELLDKIVTDKLIVPGFVTMLEKDARAQMTSGKYGMIFDGPWDIPAWKLAAPNWKYEITSLPSPDGKPFLVPFLEGSNSIWVYKETKIPTAVGQVLAYMHSLDGQKMMVILSQGNLQSLSPAANEAANATGLLDPKAKTAVDLAKKEMFIAPRPELRNADVAKVDIELKPVTPNLNDVLQGLFSGQLSNAKKQIAQLQGKLNQALDAAIAAAKKKGSTASRDDFAFKNWDPSKDYTMADYKALG